MVSAVLSGELDNWAEVGSFTEPSFNLDVPAHIDGVPDQVLKPRQTWADPDEYDQPAAKLVDMFVDNFQQFEETVANDIKAAGPSPS